MSTSRSRSALAATVALVLLASGCGGGDEGGDEGGNTGAAPSAGSVNGLETDFGVTEEPCPDAVNTDNGCIYLGLISDLTEGPFAPVSVPVTEAQKTFWQMVNDEGGIGGEFDVNIEEYTRDNKYSPEEHSRVYNDIKPNVLALAQSLGSPTTAAVIDDMTESNILATPGGWTSLYDTEDPGGIILESGASYCVESMNAVDYFDEQEGLDSLLIVHVPGDYGADAAVGAKLAGERLGADVQVVEVSPRAAGGELQGAITAITSGQPDLVIPAVAPGQLAEIVGGSVSQGYDGRFIGPGPTWNPGLLESPAGPALLEHYWQSRPWGDFEADSPGHDAMRERAAEQENQNWGYVSGWIWSYPLREALETAFENGDLTREGLVSTVASLEAVDYQGMLPEEAGNFTGSPNEQVFRQSLIAEPDPEAVEGTSVIQDFFTGDTAEAYEFEGACYETESLG